MADIVQLDQNIPLGFNPRTQLDPVGAAEKAQQLLNSQQQARESAAASSQGTAAAAQKLQEGALGIQKTQQDLKDQQIYADALKASSAPAPGAPAGGPIAPPDPNAVLMNMLKDPRGLSGRAAQDYLNTMLSNREKQATIAKDAAQADNDHATAAGKHAEALVGATGSLLAMGAPDDPQAETARAAAWPRVRAQVITNGHATEADIPQAYPGVAWVQQEHNGLQTGIQQLAEKKQADDLKIAQDNDARAADLHGPAVIKANNEAITTAPDANGLTPAAAAEDASRKASLAQKTANDLAERNQRNAEIYIQQRRVNREQKQFDATFGAGLDANGRPLSPEDRKNAALSDPTAVAIANYQIPGPTGRPTPLGKSQMDKVLAINPNYDGSKFAERNKITQDFAASGKSGKAITSADTALAHLNSISIAGKALDNGDFKALNSIANSLGAQVGQSPKVTYDTIVGMVAPEISKAVIGEAGGEGERQGMAGNFSSSYSTPVREQAIGAAAGLLGARVHKQAQAYEADMGKPLERKLSPESQAVLDRYTGGGQAAGGIVTVKDPNGGVHTFNSQADADKFKKAANIP